MSWTQHCPMENKDLIQDSFSNPTEVLEVLTQQAESVTALQAHAHIAALRFPAQEQDEFPEQIVGLDHCQALEDSVEVPVRLGSSTFPHLICQQHLALDFLPK